MLLIRCEPFELEEVSLDEADSNPVDSANVVERLRIIREPFAETFTPLILEYKIKLESGE